MCSEHLHEPCCLLLLLSRSVMFNCFATLWTVAHQTPVSMEFSRQEYWSGLPCPPPWDLPDPGIKPESPALTGVFFITGPLGKPSHEPTVGQNHLPQSPLYIKCRRTHVIYRMLYWKWKTECLIGCIMVLSIWVVYHCDCVADMTGSGSLLLGGSIVLLITSLKKVKTQNLKYGFYWVIWLLHYRTVKNLSVEP